MGVSGRPLAAHTHVRPGSRLVGVLSQRISDEQVPIVNPRVSACRDFGFHAVEIGLIVQATGMHERLCRGAASYKEQKWPTASE